MIWAHARRLGVAFAALAGITASGCATGSVSDHGYAGPIQTKFVACYGYGCRMEKRYPITKTAADRLEAIMAGGKQSPEAEREALRHAVRLCFSTRFPVMLVWGPDLSLIYNDGYEEMLATAKHAGALGAPRRGGVRLWLG